jgi:methylated-DNA-protein-cysteine methyltransferase related protein
MAKKKSEAKDKLDSFFEQVYAVARLIPKGRVTSYGAIARYLGTARSSRMVGWAMNGAHSIKPRVPAHRVVNRIGLLTGKTSLLHADRNETAVGKRRRQSQA